MGAPLWSVWTEDGDYDGHVWAPDHASAMLAAEDTGVGGDFTVVLDEDEDEDGAMDDQEVPNGR